MSEVHFGTYQPPHISIRKQFGTVTRLVLVDAMELAWQRAKYRGHQHALLPADPGLVGLNTLQHWLWQRLQTPAASQMAA
jgi:hypothetical protein